MSAYDDAVVYLDAEVHPRCDYDIYSDMRDIVDEMEAENAKLRELVIEQRKLAQMRLNDAVRVYWAGGSTSEQFDALMKATARVNRLSKELGIEVGE